MSSLKHDNIKFLDATSKTVQMAPPFATAQGEPGPGHVNVIIQMTEVTFNIGIIMLWVSICTICSW